MFGTGSSLPDKLKVMGNRIYFAADDGTTGIELWASDGTATGTSLVADINLGNTDSSPDYLTVLNNVLYFTATDGVTGVELYKYSSGSAPTRVKDIRTTSVTLGPPSSTPCKSLSISLWHFDTVQRTWHRSTTICFLLHWMTTMEENYGFQMELRLEPIWYLTS